MTPETGKDEIYTEILTGDPEREKTFKRCRPAERLMLDLQRGDRTGKRTVEVKRLSGEVLGYLDEEVSDRVVPKMERAAVADAMVLLVTGGGFFHKTPRHCYIKITV